MISLHHEIKSGRKGTARSHGAYIERAGRFSTREDLIHSGHGNLPAWANGDPASFWSAADRYERANGAAYREHVVALPNELTREQQFQLADKVVAALAGNKPFELAVHASVGVLSGVINTHLHAMFSDRVPDDINRPPEQFFSRFNPKDPKQGGCRKDSGGKTPMALRDEVIETRKKIAGVINEACADAGIPTRVDHRSLRERGITREPERHLGPARVSRMSSTDKHLFVASREGAQAAS